ncbi:helix-turn-helix domain-containing protein [Streptomyces atrovirens]|uniref:Helix-turn-helix domain-containing protein n=1 Tax=Streptomyces atrovirens TaxID=285556 RepID=A0ABW0DVM9_9ACTN
MSAQDDVAEFAALLRELKERTDRSYGSLARRLNMNTSTLHRYCAGDAVPVDFAPVERFAALCGASRAERLDLHHRWLRAAETRRHPRGPGAPAAPGTPPAPDTGPASGSAPGVGGRHTVARGRVDGVTPDAPVEGHGTAGRTAAGDAAPDGPRDSRRTAHADGTGERPPGHRATDSPRTPDAPARGTGPEAADVPGSGPATEHRASPGPRLGGEPSPGDASPPTAGPGAARGTALTPLSEPSGRPGADRRTITGRDTVGGVQDGPSGPGTGSAPVDRSGPGAGAGAGESGHASGPVAGSDVVSGPSAGEARVRRPWYRRRERVAVALAAACALLATVGSLSALPDDRRASGSGPVDAPPVTSAPSGSAEPPRGRTSSPSPSASPSSSPSATARGGPSSPEARRAPGAPSAPAGPDAPVGAPPLTWSADSHVWAYGCGHDYVVAEPPERVPPPPAPQDAGTWAAAQSAVHGGETLVELSVQGTSDTAVVLTALRVRVAGRSDPAPGNAYAMDQGCGGALTPRSFDVDLDKDRPIARAVAGNDAGTPIPAVRMPYRVSATDPEVLRVTARTADCDCRWYLELDWSSQGRTGTVRVDDHGRPFRTSGIGGLPRYEYDTSARGWKPRPQ